MEDYLIELKNIEKRFGEKQILNKISLSIKNGDFISIMGPSGCGKSTLLNTIGLLDSFEGEYWVNSKKIKRKDYYRVRNKYIGFVFQLYYLLPKMSVKDNILLPLMYSNRHAVKKAVKNLDIIAEGLGIENLLAQNCDVLSGGEKQRVAIARAMILDPYILIADEPTGALDEQNTRDVMDSFKKYVEKGHSVIMVTHNRDVAEYATIQYQLNNGELYEI